MTITRIEQRRECGSNIKDAPIAPAQAEALLSLIALLPRRRTRRAASVVEIGEVRK